MENANSGNNWARRSIDQTVQNINKTSFEYLKRFNRLVARCKFIFLRLAYSSYAKIMPSSKKIWLLYRGVQKHSGTKIEQRIISIIRKRMSIKTAVSKNLRLNFQSNFPRRSNRSMNRNKMSINISGDKTSFVRQIKSRNLKLGRRNWSISNPSSSTTTPTIHSLTKKFGMYLKRR